MSWRAESRNGLWYCVRTGFRIPDAFLCKSAQEAEASALALNMIADGNWITCDPTPRTSLLVIPRVTL